MKMSTRHKSSKTIGHDLFQFDAETGQWSLKATGKNGAHVIGNAGFLLHVNGLTRNLAQADTLTVVAPGNVREAGEKVFRIKAEAVFRNPCFTWTLVFDITASGSGVKIKSSIRNDGRSALKLGDCGLWVIDRKSGGKLHPGPQPDKQRIFAFTGGLETQYIKSIASDNGTHQSNYFQHIHNPVTSRTVMAGFITFDRMHTFFRCSYDARKKDIECAGFCSFRDFALKPGVTVDSETLYVEVSDDPYAVLTHWSDRVADHYRPNIRRKPAAVGVGLGGALIDRSSENYEQAVKRSLRMVRERLAGFGVEYRWISIANLKDGLPGNWLKSNEENFPHGFRKSLNQIIRAGIKPGLWTGLFYINEAAREAFSENEGNLYCDKETGKPRPRGRWLWAYKAKDGSEPRNYILDCSHPKSLEYLKKVYATYRKWGVRYYMLDFLDSGPGPEEDYYDKKMISGPGIPRRGIKAVRDAAKSDTHLLTASGGSLATVTGLIDTMRIGLDYGEGRGLQPRFPSYPAKYIVNGSYGSSGSPQDNCLQNTAAYFFTHRKLFLNGQNILTVDYPIPRAEGPASIPHKLSRPAAWPKRIAIKCFLDL